jgi:hypothetical protein
MTKIEIIRSLILSPCYLTIKLKDRAKLVRKLTCLNPQAPRTLTSSSTDPHRS